jgi:FkbM family methyltransferase
MMTGLKAVFSGAHVIRTGEGAGLRIASPRKADRAMRLGTYELAVQQCIKIHLSPGDVFVDIGANIGFFSLIAARRLGPGGQVYAFEPVAENAACIIRSSRLNDMSTIKVFAEAVGAHTRRSELRLAHHIGGAMLASAGTPPDVCGTVQVDVVSLDDVIDRRRLWPPALIKIDVEGAELEVLQGMSRTLHSVRPTLIYEVDDETRAGLEGKCREIAAFLSGAGYDLCPLPTSYDNENWYVEHILARPAKPDIAA